ncbi:MAG: hypothetical protein PHC61_18480 [Chitinivibrionales bacterium]|nr:hypothetical protein [Chitinivibrionales bacterium]
MDFNIDHDRFVAKNKSLARGDELDRKDSLLAQKGYDHLARDREATCFNCKKKSKCGEFRAKRGGGSTGVVSFGGDEKFGCDKFEAAPAREARGMTPHQIKALLKNVKKGY